MDLLLSGQINSFFSLLSHFMTKNQLVELQYSCLSSTWISFIVTICQNRCQKPKKICQNNGNGCSTFSIWMSYAAATVIKNQHTGYLLWIMISMRQKWLDVMWIFLCIWSSTTLEGRTFRLNILGVGGKNTTNSCLW